MPGCGKSTVGVLLAKALGTGFIDTDLIIQVQQRNTLQRLIEACGLEKFRCFEESALLSVTEQSDMVIATGGSAIFCNNGMDHLKRSGVCVYLKLPLNELRMRLSNIKTRGIACKQGETLDEIMSLRGPLYERYSDITIDCSGKNCEDTLEQIIKSVTV